MSISIDVEDLTKIGGISQPKLAVAVLAGVGVVSAWYVYRKHIHLPMRHCYHFYREVIKSNTTLSEVLTPELIIKLKNIKTSKGFTINDLVRTRVNRASKRPGIIISDEEAYEVFRELIDHLLMKFYGLDDMRELKMSCFDKFDWRKVKGGRLVDKRVLSCVITSSRNIKGFPFVRAISNQERQDIASMFVRVFTRLSGKKKFSFRLFHIFGIDCSGYILKMAFWGDNLKMHCPLETASLGQ